MDLGKKINALLENTLEPDKCVGCPNRTTHTGVIARIALGRDYTVPGCTDGPIYAPVDIPPEQTALAQAAVIGLSVYARYAKPDAICPKSLRESKYLNDY